MSQGRGPAPGQQDTANTEVRRLAAIMFTDMVGFSRLMHVDEENSLRLVDECNAIISEAVSEHHGRVLKKMGDAVLAEFSSASSAVTCAIQIQTRLRDYNHEQQPDDQIVLRIGIHLGDLIVRGQDLFGDGVNVAARLEPLSEPGGVCLSEAVYQAVSGNPAIKPLLVGEVELKNIVQKQVIYRIPSFYSSSVHETQGSAAGRRSLDFSAVDRIEELPPPTRGPLSMAVGFLVGLSSTSTSAPYAIWEWELLEPEAMVIALQERTGSAHVYIWEGLDRETREAITAFDASQTEERAARRTFRRLRRGLNDLIGGARPILDETPASDLTDETAPPGDDLRRVNRSLVESAFPGNIQRYANEPSRARVIRQQLAGILSDVRWFLALVALAIISGLTTGYYCSLKTLRIRFKDIRDVDAFLDYYIRELGFREPKKEGDELVFRATWWTTFIYSVLKLKARVSGNAVVLTGPTPMMRRMKRRMLLLAEPEQ